jgi:hypothetical protein
MSSFDDAFTENYLNTMYPSRMEGSQEFPMREGAMDAEMTAIEQTGLQKVMEQTGLTLEQIGMGLEGLGSVNIGGYEISLRDILPFVGSSEKKIDPVTGEETVVQTGTPAALQQLGQGVSATTGTGFARQLRPDMKAGAIDIVDLVGVGKAAKAGVKKAIKGVANKVDDVIEPTAKQVAKADDVIQESLTDNGAKIQVAPDKTVEIPAAPSIDTPEFKNWFSDSTIKTQDGKPQVMYHGGQAARGNFEAFEGDVIFVTPDIKFAEQFSGGQLGISLNAQPTIIPLYVKASNPFDYDNPAHRKMILNELMESVPLFKSAPNIDDMRQVIDDSLSAIGKESNYTNIEAPEVQDAIKKLGFDSFYVKENDVKNLAVYKPEQLKSVFNKGTWNPDDPRISYGVGAGGAGAASQQEDK